MKKRLFRTLAVIAVLLAIGSLTSCNSNKEYLAKKKTSGYVITKDNDTIVITKREIKAYTLIENEEL